MATPVDDVRAWLGRFVSPAHESDLDLLALWIGHTHFLPRLWSSPRLLLDSPVPGSGKTTVLEHVQNLAAVSPGGAAPTLTAGISGPALSRLPAAGPVTVLIDEADRSLDPKREGTAELLSMVNVGYKRSGSRTVNEQDPATGQWVARAMPQYAAVAMAGNSPHLPSDTRSRCVRVLLLPAGPSARIEGSDWQWIESDAWALRDALAEWAASAVLPERPDLPESVRNRALEVWRPLKAVAVAAGGRWPVVCDELAAQYVEEIEDEKEAGVVDEKPSVTLMRHIARNWPADVPTMTSERMCQVLAVNHAEMWGEGNPRTGRCITVQALGQMLARGYRLRTVRESTGARERRYLRSHFLAAFEALGEPSC